MCQVWYSGWAKEHIDQNYLRFTFDSPKLLIAVGVFVSFTTVNVGSASGHFAKYRDRKVLNQTLWVSSSFLM